MFLDQRDCGNINILMFFNFTIVEFIALLYIIAIATLFVNFSLSCCKQVDTTNSIVCLSVPNHNKKNPIISQCNRERAHSVACSIVGIIVTNVFTVQYYCFFSAKFTLFLFV